MGLAADHAAIKGHGDSEEYYSDDPLNDVEMQQYVENLEEQKAAFVNGVYEKAKNMAKLQNGEPLRDEHFFFDMFYTHSPDEEFFGWWMSDTHPIAQMMLQTYVVSKRCPEYRPVGYLKTFVGTAVVYTDPQVDQCVKDLVLLCKEHGLYVEMGDATKETNEDETVVTVVETTVVQQEKE